MIKRWGTRTAKDISERLPSNGHGFKLSYQLFYCQLVWAGRSQHASSPTSHSSKFVNPSWPWELRADLIKSRLRVTFYMIQAATNACALDALQMSLRMRQQQQMKCLKQYIYIYIYIYIYSSCQNSEFRCSIFICLNSSKGTHCTIL